jgi:cytidylate kinase
VASGSPSEVARLVVGLALDRPATLGPGRLICLDGPAGSGKTTLATAIAGLTGAPVVHMDDLFEGWGGLPGLTAQLGAILVPLSQNRAGSYRRWDWLADAWAETVAVPPCPLLVLEGVGSGSAEHAALITVLAWVEVPYDLRMERGLDRGGVGVAENWRQWAIGEQEHFAREHTVERADVLVDGTGQHPPVLSQNAG